MGTLLERPSLSVFVLESDGGGGSPASRVFAISRFPGVWFFFPPWGGWLVSQLVPSPRRCPAETLSGGGSSNWSRCCAQNATTLASHRRRSSRRTCRPGSGLRRKRTDTLARRRRAQRAGPRCTCGRDPRPRSDGQTPPATPEVCGGTGHKGRTTTFF